MKLHHQILSSSAPDAQAITLIHGWAAENAVWQDWAELYLQPYFEVHLIELPGFGQSPALNHAADWLDALAQSLPEKSHLVGWSLGGMMAQQLALKFPEKIQSLTCIASTPRFIQQDGWPNAVSPSLLKDFIHALTLEYGSVVKQFWRLQLQGSDNARPLMKKLMAHMTHRHLPSLAGLTQGLQLLRDLDLRSQLPILSLPTLWLFGEHDPLVPANLREQISQLQPKAQIQIVQGAAHMPFFSHPEATAKTLIEFIQNAEI